MKRPLATAAALAMALSLALPVAPELAWFELGAATLAAILAVIAAATAAALPPRIAPALMATAVAAGAVAALLALRPGVAGLGYWLFLLGWAGAVWALLAALARRRGGRFAHLVEPALFGLAILFLWQVLVVGFGVPQILLPSPTQIGHVLATRMPELWADFEQTFLKAVLAGFAIGCLSGFLVALLIDRVPFLQRGLLPLGGVVSAMPIVGIAPIMVMWFGFDWPSKAAVIVVMTFFPMMVNTLAGLAAADRIAHDLMRSYAANEAQTLVKLRLPAALPFIFNALKINSTLALIGAIVAEFFGSPILGLGFRISAEVARLNIDVVWAVIALAALAGSLFYGVLALIERACTFWHPSYRT